MNHRALFLKALAFLFLFSIFVPAVFAQGRTVTGFVTEGGTPMPGVQLTLTRVDNPDKVFTRVTKRNGGYRFFPIPTGKYILKWSSPGFQEMETTVTVTSTFAVQHDIVLLLDTVEEKIVIAERPPIKMDSKGETTWSRDMIEGIDSISNDAKSIIGKTAGVTITDAGEILIHGARAGDTQVVLDGVNTTNPFGTFGSNTFDISTDAIEEIQVETSGFDADFAGVQGGRVTIITKSGSNQTEGSVSFAMRSSLFDRNGAYANTETSDFRFNLYEPSFSVGGAFIKDKFFYFTNVNYQSISQPGLFTTATGRTFPYTNESDGLRNALVKLTYQLNQNNKFEFSYFGSSLVSQKYSNLFEDYFVEPESDYDLFTQSHNFSLVANTNISDKMRLESTFGFSHSILAFEPRSSSLPQQGVPCSNLPSEDAACRFLDPTDSAYCGGMVFPLTDVFVICDGETAQGASPFRQIHRLSQIEIKEKFTQFVDIGDQVHEMSYGFNILRTLQDFDWDEEPTLFYLFSNDTSNLKTVEASISYTQPRQDKLDQGTLFFQDKWTKNRFLTFQFSGTYTEQRITTFGYKSRPTYDDFINYGPDRTQAEMFALNSGCLDPEFLQSSDDHFFWNPDDPATPLTDIFFPQMRCQGLNPGFGNGNYTAIGIQDYHTFIPGLFNYLADAETINYGGGTLSPRLGIIWRPYADQDTIVSFTMGRLFGLIAETAGWETSTNTISIGVSEDFVFPDTFGNPGKLAPVFQTQGFSGRYSQPDLFLIDRHMDIPYTDEWTVSMERNLNKHLGLAFRYVNRRGFKQLFEQDINRTFYPAGNPGAAKNKNFGQIRYLTNAADSQYESLETILTKHRSRKWEMIASHTWSRALGVSSTFRNFSDPRFTRVDSLGYQETDERHKVKISILNQFPASIRLGTTLTWTTGRAFADLIRRDRCIFPDPADPEVCQPDPGGGPDHYVVEEFAGFKYANRSASNWKIDMNLTKDFSFKNGTATVIIGAENILNDGSIVDQIFIENNYTVPGAGGLSGGQLASGRGGVRNVSARPAYRFGRQWRLTFKYKF